VLTQAVILAGGMGTRLGALTLETPKPLLPIGGQPFLDYVVWNLRRFGINRLLFSVGYLSESIIEHFGDGQRFGVTIDYAVEPRPMGTGGALKLATDRLDQEFLVVNGDTLFDVNYLDLTLSLKTHGSLAGIAMRHITNTGRYGAVNVVDGLIQDFSEKSKGGPGLINGGVYVMRREALERLPDGPCSLEKNLFPGLAFERQLAGRAYSGFFIDIGLPATLHEGDRLIPQWKKKRAVLLDRDGVINVDYGYVHDQEKFVWIEGARDAIKWLNDNGYLAIVITNQAGIARGYFSEDEFLSFTSWINNELRMSGAHIDATYFCPHHPTEGIGDYRKACGCRKPGSDLIQDAITEWDLDVQHSILIGDKESDLIAGRNVGIQSVLFNQGNLLETLQAAILTFE